ncbi:hypothetical protein [Prosthecobacter fluviatilis]|uniref:Uncharacterized protein n=1 Tax=Prosthecobacter fluviatilis TaxID=445931 RepID=A0ABW0KUE1_9BACT
MSEKPLPPPIIPPAAPRVRPQSPPAPYQMAVVSDDASAKPRPTSCAQCGSAHLSTLTQLPVCESCRLALVRFPFPMWVKLAAAFVTLMVVVSLAVSQERFTDAYDTVRAEKMVALQRWEDAFQSYGRLFKTHQDAETTVLYAESAMGSHHYQEAAEAVSSLTGKYIPEYLHHRATVVVDDLDRLAQEHERRMTPDGKPKIPYRPE